MNYKKIEQEIDSMSMRIWSIAKEAEEANEAMILITTLKTATELLDAAATEFYIKAEKPF